VERFPSPGRNICQVARGSRDRRRNGQGSGRTPSQASSISKRLQKPEGREFLSGRDNPSRIPGNSRNSSRSGVSLGRQGNSIRERPHICSPRPNPDASAGDYPRRWHRNTRVPFQDSFILVDEVRGMTDPQCPMAKNGSAILYTPLIIYRSLVIDHWSSAIRE